VETVGVVRGIAANACVLYNRVEDYCLLRVLDEVDKFLLSNVLADKCLVVQLILEGHKALVRERFQNSKPAKSNRTSNEVPALFWVEVGNIFDVAGDYRYILRGDSPRIELT